MKIFTIILLLITLSTNVVVGQQDSTATKLTKEIIYKDVKDVLKSLGETLKVGTEHVYEVLVKQQVVKAITWLIIIIVLFIFCIWAWVAYSKQSSVKDYKEEGMCIVPLVASLITLIVFLWNISTIVTGFINPEYGAIETIVKMIR